MSGTIFARVPGDLKPALASERRFARAEGDCPVCSETMADRGCPVVLVFAGIIPEDRREGPGRWTNGVAVAVHARCAGVPEEEP